MSYSCRHLSTELSECNFCNLNFLCSSSLQKAFGSTTSGSSPRSTPSPDLEAPSAIKAASASLVNGHHVDYAGLNLNMTAAEMRQRIGSKKKRDPRKDDRMDFMQKYKIIKDL